MTANIRPGNPADMVRAIELLEHSHVAAGFGDPKGPTGFFVPFDPRNAESFFRSHMQGGPRSYCRVLADDADQAQGLLLAQAYLHPFGPVWLARESVFWVEPAFRGMSAEIMIRDFECWVSGNGYGFAGLAGMGDDAVIARFYQRRGYRRAETHFLKAL